MRRQRQLKEQKTRRRKTGGSKNAAPKKAAKLVVEPELRAILKGFAPQ